MSDEKPLALKLKKRQASSLEPDGELKCIVHFDTCREADIFPLSESQMKTVYDAVKKRKMQVNSETRLDSMCDSIPEQFLSDIHGHHRWCYKKFTNVSRLKESITAQESFDASLVHTSERHSNRKLCTNANSTLFQQTSCIFCGQEQKYVSRKRERLVTCVTRCAETTIKEAAKAKNDHNMLGCVDGVDLIAKEARYHESCRRLYVLRRQTSVSEQESNISELCSSRHAHDEAFEHICQHVESNIIKLGKVERMSMLRDRYVQYLKDKHPDLYNPDYSTQCLKLKLLRQFTTRLQFWFPTAGNKSELVYSSEIDIGEAIEVAFNAAASETAVLEKAASLIHQRVQDAFASSPKSEWPPSAAFLQSGTISQPQILTNFLLQVLTGKKTSFYSDRSHRLSSSIAADICVAATRGQWMIPKHVLLGMSLRHLTGSATVVTIMNRYGHCQSYAKLMELETAVANQIHMNENIIPSNISLSGNIVSHMCWDNFDVNEETRSGSNTTHTTHGIIIQEVNTHPSMPPCTHVSLPKTRLRTFRHVPALLPACYVEKRAEPVMPADVCTTLDFKTPYCVREEELIWLVSRCMFNTGCNVPDWHGWISKTTSITNSDVSNIGYMTPIFNPATETATVQQCLATSMDVCKKLNQEFTFVTFDLAMAKIAYNIVWQSPEKYKNVIIHLGGFHIICSYMGAIGKMMTGSGFEEILIESDVCASGSINQVTTGKHYNRAFRVHHLMQDAIYRLMISTFVEHSDWNVNDILEFQSLVDFPTFVNLEQLGSNEKCAKFISDLNCFCNNVRQGSLGKTAQFWIMYADSVWIMLRFLRAIKENDYNQYLRSLRQLCPLLFSADRLNYARYLPLYYTQLENLSSSHPCAVDLLLNYGISVSRSHVPACRTPIDLTIEQTINRSAKTAGGIMGLTRNVNAYHRWCLTRHQRATFLDATLEQVDLANDTTDAHKSTRPSEMRKSEADVGRILAAFDNFINPFRLPAGTANMLYCISSGQPATEAVTEDLLGYVEDGEKAAAKFIEERLISHSVDFHAVMKKKNAKTFHSMAVTKTLTTSQKKTIRITAERNLLGQMLLLSQSYDISLDKLFSYPLAPVPWSLATADGSYVKTNKAQLMHMLESETAIKNEAVADIPSNAIVIIDGNALIQSLTSLPETFGQFAMSVFKCLPKAPVIHFVTDSYHMSSIKEVERQRRGNSTTQIIGGPMTKLPRDFGSFLHNSENKTNLIKFILDQWQRVEYARVFDHRVIYFVCEADCYRLQSVNGSIESASVNELRSTQEEADTRIILHVLYESHTADTDRTIVVRSPDTDVLVLLVYFSVSTDRRILFDTGVGNKRRLISVNGIQAGIGSDIAKALPGFHAFTGSDCTSAFVRKGKKLPYKIMSQNPTYICMFQNLGSSAGLLSADLHSQLEQYVCAMYGKPQLNDVNKVRSLLFQSRYGSNKLHCLGSGSGVDLSLLPPCSSSLLQHCRRANYQAAIWKSANEHISNMSMPNGNGWKTDSDGHLQINWTEGDIIPPNVLDLLVDDGFSGNESTEYSESEEIEEDDTLEYILDLEREEDD